MRYMIEYTVRAAGRAHEQNLAGSAALLNAFSQWTPEDGLTVHAFVSDLSGNGGYVLLEAREPGVVVSFVSKFSAWNDVTVVPLMDIREAASIVQASLDWTRQASAN